LEVRLRGNGLDPIPKIEIAGSLIKLARPLRWYEYLWMGLPVLLVFEGGWVGALVGLAAVYSSTQIFRGDRTTTAKYALTGAISIAAVSVFVLVAPMAEGLIRQVLPTTDQRAPVGFHELPTGWSGAPVSLLPGEGATHRWNVDFATGSFTHMQTDFHVGDTVPISITRVYVTGSSGDAFGTGTALGLDAYLTGDASRFAYIDLTLPEGAQLHFVRSSPGTSWDGAVFRCSPSQGESPLDATFRDSTLAWNGNGWTLIFRDRMLLKFPAAHGDIRPAQGAVVAIGDGKGDLVSIARDQAGNVHKVTSPHGATVTLVHDGQNRITSGTDSLGHRVDYSYDDVGRLVAVADSREGVTRYFYDHANNMVRVEKPDRTTWISVEYDGHGRTSRITLDNGNFDRFRYKAGPAGKIAAVDVESSDGSTRHVEVN
jgi:YD repeat-containing protein